MKVKLLDVLGYSERGLVNAFVYDCFHDDDGNTLIADFLKLSSWSGLNGNAPWESAKCIGVTAIVEQSLSDFGVCDLILLCTFDNVTKASLFCEFKRGDWDFQKEWSTFSQCLDIDFDNFTADDKISCEGITSNLFSQLCAKQRFADSLANSGVREIDNGLEFQQPLNKNRGDGLRKIGKNKVVLKAVKEIEPYIANSFFLSIVPRAVEGAEFQTLLGNRNNPADWNVERWGVLPLPSLKEFCSNNEEAFRHTLDVFEFNGSQLY